MPKGKSKTKKPASRKPTRKKAQKKKPLRKKVAARQRTAKKKTVKKISTKKKSVKKKIGGKKAQKKSVSKAKRAGVKEPPSKPIMVEPGPSPSGIPPVEEPAASEEAIGTVTHYYGHLGVAVVQLNKGKLKTGSMIHIKGHTTDFTQKIESMEYEHQHIDEAAAGQSVGLKVADQTREHDIVYRVK